MALPHSQTIKDWIFNDALPWWASNGVDRSDGGYVEQVTPAGIVAGLCPFQRDFQHRAFGLVLMGLVRQGRDRLVDGFQRRKSGA